MNLDSALDSSFVKSGSVSIEVELTVPLSAFKLPIVVVLPPSSSATDSLVGTTLFLGVGICFLSVSTLISSTFDLPDFLLATKTMTPTIKISTGAPTPTPTPTPIATELVLLVVTVADLHDYCTVIGPMLETLKPLFAVPQNPRSCYYSVNTRLLDVAPVTF